MTTYTLSGIAAIYHGSNVLGHAGPIDLVITGPDTLDSFAYSVLTSNPGSWDSVELTRFLPYAMEIVGSPGPDAGMDDLLGKVRFGLVEWGAGKSATVITFDTNSSSYVFNLDGDSLPEILSPADLDAWLTSVTSTAGITSGPFAPGMDIDLDTLPGVTITEHDTIIGDASANEFHGGIGNDVIRGKGADDKLFGNKGHDRLYGDNGDDELFGGYGNDKMYGGHGDDTLIGGDGLDYLSGGSGSDLIRGGDSDDQMHGGGQQDVLVGDAGHDKMFGGLGNDVLNGGSGADRLVGNNGRDFLDGGLGDDRLYGGQGIDNLKGGLGDDFLKGGGGEDYFWFRDVPDQGNDTIADFQDGIDALFFQGAESIADLSIDQSGADTVVTWMSTSVTLLNVNMTNITDADFFWM